MSIKKIRITSSTSMKGIRLISGSSLVRAKVHGALLRLGLAWHGAAEQVAHQLLGGQLQVSK